MSVISKNKPYILSYKSMVLFEYGQSYGVHFLFILYVLF